jgi:hypothetical protein
MAFAHACAARAVSAGRTHARWATRACLRTASLCEYPFRVQFGQRQYQEFCSVDVARRPVGWKTSEAEHDFVEG